MPPPLDRDMLKGLKRADLQRICKDYGIKANLKTEALIELLVDTTQAVIRPTPPPPPPPLPRQRAPSSRIASRSSAASKLRGASASSLIIHDTDEEDNAPPPSGRSAIRFAPSPAPEPQPSLIPQPRARRPKDTQFKLGVGRPTALGGRGPRAVTRSTSTAQKGKRAKGSRSVKPTEAVIQEEEEPEPMQFDMPEAGPSGTTHEIHAPEPLPVLSPPQHCPVPDPLAVALADLAVIPVPSSDGMDHMRLYIMNLVSPLQTQIQLLQTELQQRSSPAADTSGLSDQVRLLRAEVETLRSQAALVPRLQSDVDDLRQALASLMLESTASRPSEKSLGKARASDEASSETVVGGSLGSEPTAAVSQDIPGASQPTLGKRPRDSDDSNSNSDMVEAGQEDRLGQDEQGRRTVRPAKKRPKLSKQASQAAASSSTQPAPESESHLGQYVPRGGTFTIFQGPEEPPESYIDPPPPTTHLDDLFPFGSAEGQITPPMNGPGGAIPRPPGADENAPIDPNANFSFDASMFLPITSTPFNMNLPPFTYPEPPTSPSPAAPSGGFIERAGGRIERNDLFQPLRRFTPAEPQLGTPSRAQSTAPRPSDVQGGPSTTATIDPSALMRTPTLPSVPEVSTVPTNVTTHQLVNGLPRRTVSSTEVGMQLGMSSAAQLPPDTPGVPMKRTMYGTELDGDTRFGDFGVEGVASGFWAGLSRRL